METNASAEYDILNAAQKSEHGRVRLEDSFTAKETPTATAQHCSITIIKSLKGGTYSGNGDRHWFEIEVTQPPVLHICILKGP